MTTEEMKMTIDERLHAADTLLQEALMWVTGDNPSPQLGSLAMMEALGHVQAIRDGNSSVMLTSSQEHHHHLAVPHVAIATREGWSD